MPRKRVTPARALAAVCVILPIVATLWVSTYNRTPPTLGGIPFFYWYQLLWVIITGVLMIVAYLAIRHDSRGGK
jgi:hypothetical protein